MDTSTPFTSRICVADVRRTHDRQMNQGIGRSWRFDVLLPWYYQGSAFDLEERGLFLARFKANKDSYKYLGESVGRMLACGESITDNEVALLNTLRRRNHQRFSELVEKLIEAEVEDRHGRGLTQCGRCGDVTLESGYDEDGDPICESCLEYHRYSEAQECWLHESRCFPVYNSVRSYNNDSPDDYVTRAYGERGYYWFHSDANGLVFFADEDDMNCARQQEYGPDEDDEDDGDYLPGYHSSSRRFSHKNASGKYPSIGVELEVCASGSRGAVLSELRRQYAVPGELILERDGSLDDDYGFEIVTNPMGREEWEQFAPTLLRRLVDLDVRGYQEPAGRGYGIHVNIGREHFSPLAEARIMMFLTAASNVDFVRSVAQRSYIYNADYDIGSVRSPNVGAVGRYLFDVSQRIPGTSRYYRRKIYGRGKFCPVNWKSSPEVAEFRIFQSTLNEDSFMKNLEFVWALHAWTKPEAATGNSYDYKDFVTWLAAPQRRAEFPHLLKYLSKKRFFTTNGDTINNQWLSFINKSIEEDACEPETA